MPPEREVPDGIQLCARKLAFRKPEYSEKLAVEDLYWKYLLGNRAGELKLHMPRISYNFLKKKEPQ